MTTQTPHHMDGCILYSRGRDKYDNAPEQRTAATFDEFENAVIDDRSPQKGKAFICAPLRSGVHYQKPDEYPGNDHWRLKNYAEPRCFLPFDFDGFSSPPLFEATKQYLARYRGFGYTTASYTDEAPRARAILQASRAVTRGECIIVCQAIQAEMLGHLGVDSVQFDESVYRGEQPVYTPVTTSVAFHFDGSPVDVDAILAPQAPVSPTPTGATGNLADLGGFRLPDIVSDGEGRERVILQLAGHLRGKGLDQNLIELVASDYNRQHINPPLDEAVVLDRCRRYESEIPEHPARPDTSANDHSWPDPEPLGEHLPPVPAFTIKLLPKMIGAYVQDVAERMGCPLDFPAIGAVVALATAIGSRICCKPYANGTWLVPAGAWGMAVSSPSAVKSPPLQEMLRPLKVLDKQAADQFARDLTQYEIDKAIYDNAVKAAVRAGNNNPGVTPPAEPRMTRYMVNDSTYEMLIAIAKANPQGFLIWRDELIGWFHSLAKENQKEARGLYLTGWSGTEGYATDRIGRGHVRADCVNLSLLGTIQPNVLRQIVRDAVAGGAGDDGLIPRFQFAVYPDPEPHFTKVDRYPNFSAMQHYEERITELVNLNPTAVGASITLDGTPYLPFDEEAQIIFDEWRQKLEDRIRRPDTDEHPAMLAHLGKYRSLFPKLALILHLAAGQKGPIGKNAANRAKVWIIYLEAHARRIYHTATNRAMQCAVALSNKIKAGQLRDGFTRSEVLVKEWANLRTAEEVNTALTVLRDMNWLFVVEDRRTGGRPAERYHFNPKVKRAA